MKKLVSVLFALLLIGGSFAFADGSAVNVSAWGRLMFVPARAATGDFFDALKDAGTDYTKANVSNGPAWSTNGGMNTGFAVGASNDHVGFSIDLDVNGGTSPINFGDQAKAWVKFNDMVKVQLGMIEGDVLRGKIGDSGFLGALRTIGGEPIVQTALNEDSIFPRFYPKAGMLIDVTPAEGVYLGASLDSKTDASYLTSEDMFKSIQIGAGYVIPSVGHVRAQYVGGADTDAADAPKYMDVAFAYTAMEGLLVDAGLKYQMTSEAGKSSFAVAGKYKMDALSTVARLYYGFGKNAAGNDDPIYQVSADVGYMVADPLTIGAEVSYKKEGDPTGLTVGPYGKIAYAGGFLKTGFEYSTFTKDATAGDYTTWAIPVMIEYGF